MRIIDQCLKNPAAVAAVVALAMIFGLLAANRLPLQLFPDIDRPQMNVQASWRSASPQEVESELLDPMEEVLQGLPGLQQMDGNAGPGGANVGLTFAVGTDMRAMLVEVLGRLNRLPPLPADADPPVVQLSGDEANQALSWFFVQLLPGTSGQVLDYRRFVEERVVPKIEAVPGVAGVQVNAGPPDELGISIDLDKAAALGISVPLIAQQATRARDVSGGFVESGRRQYTLRFAGKYQPEELGDLILAWRDGRPVYLGDVATIERRHPERSFFAYQNGNPAIALRVDREAGANVLATLNQVKDVVKDLREGELQQAGLGIEQSFDSSLFINRAIGLLSGNLLAGVLLAVGCLWWFLRDLRATLLIATAIPISLLTTFIVLELTGRSLNVISLAGLAFAVGMVMDAAVVVAENIVRLRENGESASSAAANGTRQVAVALWASTLTTVAVFLPVIFMGDVEGQLFGDLALTVSIAVSVSLLVALTVLPAGARRWLGSRPQQEGKVQLDGAGYPRLTHWLMRVTARPSQQWAWIAGLVVAPIVLSWALAPPLDYLPPVKRAAVDAFFDFPPGMSSAAVNREIAPALLERMKPYMDGDKEPQLKNWYILLWPGGGTIGARVVDEDRIEELEQIVRSEVVTGFPDTRAFAFIGELFGGFGGSARAIQIHLQSGDAKALERAALAGREQLNALFPGGNVQSFPNPDQLSPELRVSANDRRLAESGWTRPELGTVIRALGDGVWLGEYFDGDERLPIIMDVAGYEDPAALLQAPMATPLGGVVPLADLAQVETTLSPAQIRRVDRRRTLTLTVDPPADLSLEEALARVNNELVPALRKALPDDAGVRVSGSADRLNGIVSTMSGNFALALLVLFLLMAAIFRSLRDSAFVMLALPMAMLGGVLGMRVLGLVAFQPLDLLSMIGFIMLLGMVINNAILLVAKTRESEASGLDIHQAVAEALNQRVRPILIAALTGVFGALPMAINPGPGAVIYRGLAAVTVGGVALSLIFTLVLMPALLRLDLSFLRGRRGYASTSKLQVATDSGR
ncbi:efflux RND transporter permease subunit [Pseudomarimonas arenosa]|uniref:Efflux RND transporter permease subunit n=1 Tax=Pseudomarimonas arenosa TaxID=2774145 RepID=A0AAW3ZK31_9GAMM|nr:efflux RND transporter permease subunit [Pseudomarimonas arenosa]MBD8526473.1 efflux RND transporter permease subunit [Pseudomarimonas arenosa]